MIVYYVGDGLTAELKLKENANLEQVDALMARDGMQRVTKEQYVMELKPKAIKKCPRCATGQLVIKTKDDNTKFLGCVEYPHCKHTEPLPLDMLLRESGAPTLPGLE